MSKTQLVNKLAAEYRDGLSDGTQLIENMDGLIHKIVLARWGHNEDLYQEGRIAVLAATDGWDPDKGAFITWAFHKITHAVNSAGPSYLPGLDIPWGTLSKYRRAMRETNGDATAAEEYAREELHFPGFTDVHNAVSPCGVEHLGMVGDVAEQVAAADQVQSLLDRIPGARERWLFSMFYGIEDGTPRSAKELARLDGMLTAQDVRNSLARSRRLLRRTITEWAN